jgi:hypothetical protein
MRETASANRHPIGQDFSATRRSISVQISENHETVPGRSHRTRRTGIGLGLILVASNGG